MSDKGNNKILKYLRSVKTRRVSLRIQNRLRNKAEKENASISSSNIAQLKREIPCTAMSVLMTIPEEILHLIFNNIPLYDLSSLTLTSTVMRNKILAYHFTRQALGKLKPDTTRLVKIETKNEKDLVESYAKPFYTHFQHLGIFMKRLTCLFTTKQRLGIVSILLEKVPYAGASRVDDRLSQALHGGLGGIPSYEKYVRVFYREIFLDKAGDDTELGYWLHLMLSPLPIVFQARLLYMLYGPEDDEEELILWDKMTTCPTFFGVTNEDLECLAKALYILHKYNVTTQNKDNLVSVFEELIALPGGWCLENIAKLLKMCGKDICCEFLGSKAVNGRIQELAYISYYIAQALMEKKANESETKAYLEWFVKLMKQILTYFSCEKQKQMFISTLFDVWQETIMGLNEDIYTGDSVNETDLDLEIFAMSVHNLAKITTMLLLENIREL